MATKPRKKQTSHSERKHSRPELRDPRSGDPRNTFDPRAKRGPERKPVTSIARNSRETSGARSGDLEGLETDELEGNKSVRELANEGQDLEAEELEGFERLRLLDLLPLRQRRVPDHREAAFKDRNRI